MDPHTGPLAEFAQQLRQLRIAAGRPTYRQMSSLTHYSASALARAADGSHLPTLQVVLAYVVACGADVAQWSAEWDRLRAGVEPVADPPSAAGSAPPPPSPEVRQLPPDVADFVGRQAELDAAEAAVRAGAGAVTVLVTGLPGVGKSAFALRLAHRLACAYPDGLFHLRLFGAGRRRSAADALGVLLRSANVRPEAIPSDVDERAALYRSLLYGRRCLVLIDDAYDEAQLRPLLAPEPCATIVTSRNVLGGIEGAHRAMLDVLTETEATEMLCGIARPAQSAGRSADVHRVVRLCGRLPLAIRIAGARLATRQAWTVRELTGRLTGAEHRLDELTAGDLVVRSAFRLSYDCLDPIGRTVFRRLGLLPTTQFRAAAVEALTGLTAAEVSSALEALVDANLIGYATDPCQYQVHDLLWVYAGELCRTEDDAPVRDRAWCGLAEWYARASVEAAALATPMGPLLAGPPAVPAGQGTAAAATSWLDLERPALVAVAAGAARTGPGSAAWRIADALRGYLLYGGHTADWLVVAGAGRCAAAAAGDDRARAAMDIGLGQAYSAAGDHPSATRHLERALRHARSTGWGRGEATALNNLGAAYFCLDRLAAARGCYQEALACNRRTGDRRGEGIALGNLGSVHRELGELTEALRCHDLALQIHRETRNRHSAVTVLSNRANAYRDQGRFGAAVRSCTEALGLLAGLGSVAPEAKVLVHLAGALYDAGEYPHARRQAHYSLEIAVGTGDRRVQTDARNVLGLLELRAGRLDPAREQLDRALRGARAAGWVGAEVDALVGLARLGLAAGEPTAARTAALRAYARARGADSPRVVGAAHVALAEAHVALGDRHTAAVHARAALAVLGSDRYPLRRAEALLALAHAAEHDTRRLIAAALGVYARLGRRPGDWADALAAPRARSFLSRSCRQPGADGSPASRLDVDV